MLCLEGRDGEVKKKKELEDGKGMVKRVHWIIQKPKLDWVLIFESVVELWNIYTRFRLFTSILDLFQA